MQQRTDLRCHKQRLLRRRAHAASKQLEVDRAASGTAYVNYPIRATVGLIGSGNTNSIRAAWHDRTSAVRCQRIHHRTANLRSCEIAGARVTVKGDGSQAYATIDGIIPPECLGTDSQRNYNFYVLLDPVENVSSESNKFLVYNVIEQSSFRSRKSARPLIPQPEPKSRLRLMSP